MRLAIRQFPIILTVLFFYFSQAHAHHPAAIIGPGAGGPIRTFSAQTLPKGKADFSFHVEYFDFDSFSDGELRAFALGGSDVHSTESVLHLSLMAGYGLTEDLTLGLKLPYARVEGVKEAHADEPDDVHRHGDSSGIGDLTLFGQYRFLNAKDYQGSFLLGLKTPSGETTVRDIENERFETEFQPGSGSWDPSVGMAFQKSFGKLTLYTSFLYKFVTEGAQDVNLGDAFHYNAAAAYSLPTGDFSCDLIFEINGESRKKQELSGLKDPNSGGNLILLSPGVRLGWKRLSATVSAGFPVLHELNGIQNEMNYTLLTSLSFAF